MSPSRIFADDFGYVPNVYRFALGYQSTSELASGEGYWVEFPVDGFADIYGANIAVASKELSAGWNLIGNPFDVDLPVNLITFSDGIVTKTYSEAVVAGWIGPDLFGYQPSGYISESSALAVWNGYWLESFSAGITIEYVRP
ncbi:MAG: hypothetical protein H7X80_02020 [bacterium]|nr:hypothetical protein [Candidatus Kapabacteria bacterium]